jgi:hypothetical protein
MAAAWSLQTQQYCWLRNKIWPCVRPQTCFTIAASKNHFVLRYEMKATGRADLAANEKVLDLYTSNLQLEDQLHGVRKEVEDAKSLAEKVPRNSVLFH